MRRLVAILAALVLSLSLSVPIVAAQEGQYVTGITVTSATVNKMGEVHITGYLYCQGFQEWDDRNVEVQGQLIQAFGRKTTVRGGMGGGAWCELNGPTNFDAWAWGRLGQVRPRLVDAADRVREDPVRRIHLLVERHGRQQLLHQGREVARQR
jgi:hypothetical protein